MTDRPPVDLRDSDGPVERVCGVDVAYAADGSGLIAAAVVLERTTLAIVDQAVVEGATAEPYVPGRLAWREAPWVVAAIAQLGRPPDLVVCDGQGIAHPDGFGLACRVGTELDLPTIGCAKNHLVGTFDPPARARGSRSPLRLDGAVVGTVLRTQHGVKPVYVSPGHRISVDRAAELVLELAPRYRLPETTRAADQLVRRLLRAG